MEVREATPDDVDVLATLFETSERAAERLLVERSVVVGEEAGRIVGACAFDRWEGAVHVTRLASRTGDVRPLLGPAVDRAAASELPVEVLVVDDDLADALRAAGFADAGSGPRFGGRETRMYRQEP